MATGSGWSATRSSPEIAPDSSILLLVVCGEPPPSSVTCCSGVTTIAPQPPGPGLPFAAPSVKTIEQRSMRGRATGRLFATGRKFDAAVLRAALVAAVVGDP